MRNRNERKQEKKKRRNQSATVLNKPSNMIFDNDANINLMQNIITASNNRTVPNFDTNLDRGGPNRPRRPRRGIRTNLLAAVLGSVAFICIAAVIIAWLVKRRRRRRNTTNSPSETVTQNIRYVERNAMERGSGVYETIGPALPNRPCATKQLPPETTKAITAIDSIGKSIVNLPEDEDAYLKPTGLSNGVHLYNEDNYLNFNDDTYSPAKESLTNKTLSNDEADKVAKPSEESLRSSRLKGTSSE